MDGPVLLWGHVLHADQARIQTEGLRYKISKVDESYLLLLYLIFSCYNRIIAWWTSLTLSLLLTWLFVSKKKIWETNKTVNTVPRKRTLVKIKAFLIKTEYIFRGRSLYSSSSECVTVNNLEKVLHQRYFSIHNSKIVGTWPKKSSTRGTSRSLWYVLKMMRVRVYTGN